MQAVILAAGKSTRTYPLTLTRPKPLLKAANRTLLEHNLGSLDGLADEVIIIVGYKKEMIKKRIGSMYKNIKIRYAEQENQLGTGNALLAAEKYIKGSFVCLYGDDIYSKKDFRNVMKNRYSILVQKVKNPGAFGVVLEKDNILTSLVEKPKKFISDLANAGLYKFDKRIFSIIKKLKKSKRGEYELTDAVKSLARQEKVYCVASKGWMPIGYPWDLLKADMFLRKNKNSIGSNARISGKVKNSSIGNGCIIEGQVKNSVVMDGTIIDENSVVENSVIGENVHLSGRITDKMPGAIIGDGCELVNVEINPGVKISPFKKIKNKTIRRDVK
ncbi:NTP transferase domain-containing protein [Candidatus Woesearchaeota archaeon]|nr:NTP transferase domain-containing protein [Candidatus Woesearchaeota archaeon]